MAKQQDPVSKPETIDTADKTATGKPVKSARSGLALLALLLALVSIATQAWLYLRDDSTDVDEAIARLQNARQADQADNRSLLAELESLSLRIGQLENRRGPDLPPDFSTEINSLQREMERLARQSGAMQSRLNEQSAITQTNDRHMLRAEVEYLLRLGNERLQLFGDRQAAMATLHLAEQQLAAMDDPLMLPVRQQLQEDIRSLSGIQAADPLIILSSLQALETSLPDWPLKQSATAAVAQPEVEDNGLWARTKRSMQSLVTISKQNEPVLTLEQIDWLQERIRAQLQVARIASMNADQDLFEQSLQMVLQWHAEHYDPGDSGSIEVRKSLQELISTELKPGYPDITRALREMQFIGSPLDAAPVQPAAAEDTSTEPVPESGANNG
jgi:uroporphyrin-3 C-methyltransferase